MKTNLKWIHTLFFLLITTFVLAQNKKISGTVTDDKGKPVSNVLVTVEETGNVTATDADGNYSIDAAEGQTIVFDNNGSQSKEKVGASGTISPKINSTELKEVVVTALGITREKKALGYATQGVSGDEISDKPVANFADALSGEVAGLQVQSFGGLGGSANMIVRGYNSISGNNQALVVIDGIPVINSTSNSSDQKTGRGGYDYGNAASDINPNDIASVNVLKGSAATALYGSRAGSGAIIITTKKGKTRKGIGVSFNSSYMSAQADKTTLPRYQNKYGAGYGPFYQDVIGTDINNDPIFWEDQTGSNPIDNYFTNLDNDGNGQYTDLYVPFAEDASYGAAFDPSLMVYQWNSLYPELSTYGQKTPWVAGKNNPNSIFKTGHTFTNSVSFGGGNDLGTFRLGYTNFYQTGVLPNSEIKKNTITFNGSYNFTENLKASAGITYTNTKGKGRYGTGYDSNNIMQQFRQWTQMNVDFQELKDAYFSTRKNITWNPTSYDNTLPIYSDNPYWVLYENYQTDNRDRYLLNGQLEYKINSWLNVLGRVTRDSYSETRQERRNVGSSGSNDLAGNSVRSRYYLFNQDVSETNYDLMLNFNKKLTEDLVLDGNLGYNLRVDKRNSLGTQTNGGINIPGLYTLTNTINAITLDDIFPLDWTKKVDGMYVRAGLGYKDTYFVEGTFRRDRSSALPKDNNTYYYPSVSTSIVFSNLIKADWLSFGKFRANYAEVGNDTDPYQVFSSYVPNPAFGSSASLTNPSTLNNIDLKAERSKDWELGLEMQFFRKRFGFDVSYYQRKTQDLISSTDVSGASGYSRIWYNAGSITNKGVEVFLNATPIKTQRFQWDIKINFAKNVNELTEIADGIDYIQLADVQGGISIGAKVGDAFGVIRGTDFVYDGDGNKIVKEAGVGSQIGKYYVTPNTDNIIGDINPDWTGGVKNTFKYDNFSLSFLIDIKKGGDVFSLDTWYGYATGLYDFTAGTNDLGNPVRNTLADGGGVILDGVQGTVVFNADGSYTATNLAPNTTRASASDYRNPWGYARTPNKAHVYDAGFVKLREASISYALPARMLEGTAIQGFTLSLIGRNLWIIQKNVPYADPEAGLSSGNIQGYQSGSYPGVREIGASIKLDF